MLLAASPYPHAVTDHLWHQHDPMQARGPSGAGRTSAGWSAVRDLEVLPLEAVRREVVHAAVTRTERTAVECEHPTEDVERDDAEPGGPPVGVDDGREARTWSAEQPEPAMVDGDPTGVRHQGAEERLLRETEDSEALDRPARQDLCRRCSSEHLGQFRPRVLSSVRHGSDRPTTRAGR